MTSFDLAGVVRRIRRTADLSQRELAQRLGLSKSMVAAVESGNRTLEVSVLVRAADLADLRLALLDAQGQEVGAMSPGGVRDMGNRRFPAHLDTRYGDEDWWHGVHRYDRPEPWYTFDRSRSIRDIWREILGTPDDHQLPQPGDSPQERRAARARAAAGRREAGDAAEVREWPDLVCTCPPECDELDRGERPVHAAGCLCGCDLG